METKIRNSIIWILVGLAIVLLMLYGGGGLLVVVLPISLLWAFALARGSHKLADTNTEKQ